MTAPIMPEPRSKPRHPLAVRARVAVTAARLISALSPKIIQKILTVTMKGAGRPDPPDVLGWRNAVNSVSHRCAGEACLQRSIAVMLLARSFGVSPTWKTGFRPDPFIAHAWVEVDGKAIGEPDAVAEFRPVLVVAPKYSTKIESV